MSDEVGHEARRGGQAAVDAQVDARGKTGKVAGQIDGGLGHLLGLADAPDGMHLNPGAGDLFAKLRHNAHAAGDSPAGLR